MDIRKSPLLLIIALTLFGQPPPPGRGGPPPPGGLQAVRRRLAGVKAEGETQTKILSLAKLYLDRSESSKGGSAFAATRFLSAADALIGAAEHQQHLQRDDRPPPPAGPDVLTHIEHVYLRIQQAEYFIAESADPNSLTIADFARQYYQSALRAAGSGALRTADECAKSADDLMRALENLALSNAKLPKPGPGPGKP